MKWFRLLLVLVALPVMMVTWTLGSLAVMGMALWEYITTGTTEVGRRFWIDSL